MLGETDAKDKRESRTVAIALIGLIAVLALAVLLLFPVLSEFTAIHFSPGLGLKYSAVVSFFVTVVLMLVFAVASGDGFIGEIQFILAAFFSFFMIIWLLVAWIF